MISSGALKLVCAASRAEAWRATGPSPSVRVSMLSVPSAPSIVPRLRPLCRIAIDLAVGALARTTNGSP